MRETNRQRLLRKRVRMIMLFDTAIEQHGDAICKVCDEKVCKNLGPSDPACEGRWCAEAVELWLDEEAEEDDTE